MTDTEKADYFLGFLTGSLGQRIVPDRTVLTMEDTPSVPYFWKVLLSPAKTEAAPVAETRATSKNNPTARLRTFVFITGSFSFLL